MEKATQPDLPEVISQAPWLRRFPLRSPTLPPATHTNAYLFGEGEFLIIDPGTPDEAENNRLLGEVEALGRDGHRAFAIFLTHQHHDHVSGAAYLQKRLGVPIFAHAITAEKVLGRGLVVERTIVDGEVLPFGSGGAGCVAMHTPGHAPGHLCLFDRGGGGMIVGDMVASVGTILVSTMDGGDMAAYLASLEKLIKHSEEQPNRPLRLWPAHGASIPDGEGYLRFYIKHRLLREERVVEALRMGPASALDLVPAAYADKPDVDARLASLALLAHLDKLEKEGRARKNADGVWSLV